MGTAIDFHLGQVAEAERTLGTQDRHAVNKGRYLGSIGGDFVGLDSAHAWKCRVAVRTLVVVNARHQLKQFLLSQNARFFDQAVTQYGDGHRDFLQTLLTLTSGDDDFLEQEAIILLGGNRCSHGQTQNNPQHE